MPHTVLHTNSFDWGGGLLDDYTGGEVSSNVSYSLSYSGTSSPYQGYGRFLIFTGDNVFFAPALSGAPLTTVCVSGLFCFLSYQAGTSSTANTAFIRFWDGAANQVQVEIRAKFNSVTNRIDLEAYRGTTFLASASSAISGGDNNWFWISVLVHINSSSGIVRIKAGPSNATVMNFTGNTQNTANARIDHARIGRWAGSSTSHVAVDNLVITSCLSSDPALDERRLRGAIVPTGNDAVAWTPSSGTNWSNVNEMPPNSDTSYNTSNTSGAQDTFVTSWPALSGATIHSVKVCALARRDDAGPQNLQLVIKSGATSYPSSNRALTDTYFRHFNTWVTNPATSLPWVPGDFISTLTFGYRIA